MLIGAIDIGGTKTLIAVVNEQGILLQKRLFPTIVSDWQAHFTACAKVLKALCEPLSVLPGHLEGIGVNCNGMVDAKDGILLHAPFSNWSGLPVANWFRERTENNRIYIENDVNACALGEMYFGWKQRFDSFLWMTVSTGVGGAVVERSHLIRGNSGIAGEVGHLKVEYEAPLPCPCGQKGCLEAHASGTAITKAVAQAALEQPNFAQKLRSSSLLPDAPGCEALARTGDKTALMVYQNAGRYLGRGISYAANLLNPQAVILGGGVARALDLMLPEIRKSIRENVIPPAANLEVVYTRLGYETALLGAAALVLNGIGVQHRPVITHISKI